MSAKFFVVKVYEDGHGNIFTTPAKDRILSGYGVKKLGSKNVVEVFSMKKAAMMQADCMNGQ